MNLSEVLDRATDAIESPQLAGAALGEARARQARRRSLALVAAVGVVATVGVGTLAGGRGGDDGPGQPAAPSSSSTPAGDERAIGPRWDPRSVPEAPLRRSVLPESLAPPALPPDVAGAPMEAAVLAWPAAGRDLRLLGTDGEWRRVKDTADAVASTGAPFAQPALSSDGTEVAMATDDGLLVVDVTTGDQEVLPWPAPLAPPSDTPPAVDWLPGDDGFYVATWPHAWFLDRQGAAERAPFGHRYAGGVAIDPDGGFVEKRYTHHDLRLWRDGEVVATSTVGQWGERLVTRFGRVALTGGGNGLPGDGGPLVLDAETGEVVGYRPIRDRGAIYTDNGHLTALGFLDPDTALYVVGPARREDRRLVVDAWHLVAWDLRSGDFERLSSGGEAMWGIDVAPEVLAGG
ncbi:hypothetical protein [Nocardioides sp. TF02-7]|uniref:hypothetical protein n=1 Tax=Nocardioides sp. TF02-7 TaxID=2917724 RepID=UPI001F050753|nr:hypothetical protein [Nocardioides sp. TF02-7]UMG92778.1 hypothetical protein MF408_24275 [Nocardioides sp. TF02-7]